MDVTEDPQRFEAASLAALFGAVLLLVSPFLTWFDPGGSAWSLFELLDLLLVGIALYVGVTATTRLLDVDQGADPRGVPIAGGVALAAVFATLLEPPPVAVDSSTGFGVWLALFGAVVITAAGLLDLARVSVTVSVGAREDEARADAPINTEHRPQTWTPPAPPAPETSIMARSAPASTEAPPSRSPSLLRPNDPPRTDQVPEGD